MPRFPNFSKALPRCQGPKLDPFHDRKAVVTFLRLLSEVDSKGHAHVFEVSIGSEYYALKVFKFYDDDEDRAGLVGVENSLVPNNILHAHMDPFYNECRAYGRFAETHQDGKIAVRCHGHLSIPAEREDELEQKFGVEDWDRPDREYAIPVGKRQPLRAIVKEMVLEDVPLTQRVVKKMLKDLKKMRDLGVYPLDVRARNYRAGRLLDMSVAITEPHYLFEIRPRWQIRSLKREDLLMFDKMISDEGINTWVRALPKRETCEKLRSFAQKNTSNLRS